MREAERVTVPAGGFGTILLDPPWQERGAGKVKRGADRHYSLLSVQDIWRVIWTCPLYAVADSAHCYLWVTNNYLPHGLELLRQMGFRYVTNSVWVKLSSTTRQGLVVPGPIEFAEAHLQIGLGQYQRGAHELLLFGVKGKAMVPATEDRLPSVVFAERGRHSAKPEVFYDRIERVSSEPRLELFARLRRRGWTSWGLEV